MTKPLSLMRKLLMTSACAVAVFSASAANAQDEATGIADPGRIQDQFLQETILPKATPDVDVREMALQGAPAGAENVRFILNNLVLEGAGALSESQLSSVYADKVGQEITLAELYGIANDITVKYRNSGYILTRAVVPPQTIDGGVARLQIVEGYINNIVIQGPEEEGAALDLIRKYASHIGTGGALNVRELERELLLINDLPGVSARSVLSPSSTPGAADLLIIVERDPWEALASIDNYGSRFLGPVQVGGAATANSWFGLNEAITGQVVIAPDSGYELAYGALSYEQPVGNWGTRFRVLGSLTRTEPGFTLDAFDVKGQSDLVSLQLRHPFLRSRSENLEGRVTFDWRDVESKNNVADTLQDRIRVARVGGRYDFLDTLLGVAVNAVDLEISQGVDILGSSDEGDLNLTRAEADPQFTKAEFELQRLQRVTDSVNLLLVGRGQWSSGPLFASEEFSVGGINLGRGFDPSEVTGDDGLGGKAEVQWNDPYHIESPYIDTYQLFTFFDAGRVWDQDATTSSEKTDTLTSVGGGFRISFTGDLNADFTWAVPLNRDVQTQGDQEPRAFFGLNKRF